MAVTPQCGMKLMLLSVIFFIPAVVVIIYVQSADKPSDYGHLLTAAYLLMGAGAFQFFIALCIYQFLKADARSDRAVGDRRGNITAHTAGVAVSHSGASATHRHNYEQASRRPVVTGRYPVAPPLVPHMDHSPRILPRMEHSPRLVPHMDHSPRILPRMEHSPRLTPRGPSPVPPSAPPQHTATQDTCESPPPSYEEAMRTMV